MRLASSWILKLIYSGFSTNLLIYTKVCVQVNREFIKVIPFARTLKPMCSKIFAQYSFHGGGFVYACVGSRVSTKIWRFWPGVFALKAFLTVLAR